ncbi:hypothetical protein KP509_17G057800 [Ceratopteris richardii]|uniref:Heterokaryon incompatibility domain-containing protein n=1 Tax=Ceratopteris richardii TaxID=49495 RepID=A0A8T2SX82_CERRI|nr:hypothetical protein KP509_17G057800 [Ceratopteris richardii]KAH7373464.1 hypothetical protein KP509_17G057800 [Ceratopteris richardii]
MVLKSELSFNKDGLPKRLVDLDATISSGGALFFVEATDWNFHIISHTWRTVANSMKNRCGEILKAMGWTREMDPDGHIYTKAFNDPSLFKGLSYYNALIDFFIILQSDGVKLIWLDIISTNQYDAIETATEMVNMGGFYGLSLGCYVLPHGIGTENGYKVLDTQSNIPRWFSRVWTLQESVLPQNVYFLVEKFDEQIIEYIKSENVNHAHDNVWIDWDDNDTYEKEVGEKLSSKGGGDRSRRKIASSSNLYALGARAYFEMMGTYLGVRVHGLEDLSPKLFEDFYEQFGEIASGNQEIIMETIVKQVRVRNASSEEDRVLGILGMMGFKEVHQLEKNRGLSAQVVSLAKLLFAEKGSIDELLLNLCASEYEGYEVNGISWAPDLTPDPDDSRAQFRRYFIDYVILKHYEAEVVNVGDDGSLHLKAQTATAKLVRSNDVSGTSYYITVGPMMITLSHDTDLDDNLPIHAYYANESERSWYGGMMVAAPNIHKLKSYPTNHKHMDICDITLVYLGDSHQDPHKKGCTCILMACIPIGKNIYHKIGVVHPKPSFAIRARRLFHMKATNIVIGGVGGDLTPYLKNDCQVALKSLSASA